MNLSDARVKETRSAIRKSFLALLRKKPVGRITVKEICELSRINRSTFYKHYSDPLDLLEKMEEEILDQLRESLKPPLPEMGAYLDKVLAEMEERGDVFLLLASENGDPGLPAKIFQCCYKTVYPRFREKHTAMNAVQLDMVYRYLEQGSGGILHCWIDGGMKAPRENVLGLLLRMNEGALEELKKETEGRS